MRGEKPMKKFVKNPHNHDDLVLLDREMLFAGYTCKVACNYREAGTTDPWSGMPDIDNDFTYFDNAEEAANFAKTQLWPFNHDVTSRVEPLTLGETWDEMREREAKEAAAKKAAKEAKEAEIAVLDAPLLFETELDEICDTVIAVLAGEKLRLERESWKNE